MKAVALVLLAFLASPSFAHEFAVCRGQHDELGVKALQFAPDPPVPGQAVKVRVSGQAHVDIPEGKLHVDIRVLGITVESQQLELCDVVQCPLQSGKEFSAEISQEIPEGAPAHSGATVRVSLIDAHGQVHSCLESYVQLGQQNVLGAFEGEDNAVAILEKDIEFLFAKWKQMFPKAKHDLKVFGENLLHIAKHNAKKDQTFTMAMNEFGSLTADEFASTRMGLREPKNVPRKGPMKAPIKVLRSEVALADPPAELDWTTKGVVSQVKNQGSCGSCWAFSAVASLESAYALKTGNLIEFSEQELVSCDDNDYGCQGGLMDSAFDWIEHSSAGLCSEADYAYTSGTTSARGECMRAQCTNVPESVPKGYIDIPPNESALLAGLAEHGPVAVAIEADQAVFQFYHSGVLTGACGTHLDHGVLLVGYGIDAPSGTSFWKVKNSWGPGWGEAGYVRIQRGKRWPVGGECGIASHASFPVY